MLLVAIAAALLCASASAGDPPPRPWDVAIGKRPYVNETEGHLLLTTPGLAGQRLRVTASLCAGTLGNWSWDVTGGADQLLSISLAQLPHLVNNDMLVTVTHASGGDNSSSIRRRFQRAWKSDMRNTVQVDHHTRGLRVDGEPWFGVGWYQYAYTSFVPPDCDPTKVDKSPSGQQKNLECMTWGINNMTEAMGAMASRGINMMMPYSFSPFARHGLSHDLPGGREGATSIRDKLILSYFDEAAKHGAKVLFDCAGLYIDVGDKAYTNETLQNIRDSVELVKDHPALLGYYTCKKCSRSLCAGPSKPHRLHRRRLRLQRAGGPSAEHDLRARPVPYHGRRDVLRLLQVHGFDHLARCGQRRSRRCSARAAADGGAGAVRWRPPVGRQLHQHARAAATHHAHPRSDARGELRPLPRLARGP